jgi:hypothetical protein
LIRKRPWHPHIACYGLNLYICKLILLIEIGGSGISELNIIGKFAQKFAQGGEEL